MRHRPEWYDDRMTGKKAGRRQALPRRSESVAKTGERADEKALERIVRKALKKQYHAALKMLRLAIEQCPEALWTKGGDDASSGGGADEESPAFWRVAYHAAFYTHFYLQPNQAAFVPWKHHRPDHQFLGPLPWPPHRAPKIGKPYGKARVLKYLGECDAMVDRAVDAMDLTSSDCGFSWYRMSKLSHQILNIRHIQHHAAHLSARLRAGGEEGVGWVG
jgi:hypothetical protein